MIAGVEGQRNERGALNGRENRSVNTRDASWRERARERDGTGGSQGREERDWREDWMGTCRFANIQREARRLRSFIRSLVPIILSN